MWYSTIPSDTGWIDLVLNDDITVGNYGGTPQYRVIDNHVFLRGGVSLTYTGSNVTVSTIPFGIRPETNQYRLCACSGSYVVREIFGANGNIVIEWIRALSDGSYYNGTNPWIILDCDYWLD